MSQPLSSPGSQHREAESLVWFDWKILPAAAVTVVLFWVLLRRLGGYRQVTETLLETRWELLGAALATLFLDLIVAAVRWQTIVRAMGYTLPVWRALRAMLAAWPFALLTPSRAGDLVRALSIRSSVPPLVGAGSVVAEKVIDLQVLACFALVASLVSGFHVLALVAAAVLLTALTAFALCVRADGVARRLPLLARVAPKIQQLALAFRALTSHPRLLAAVVMTSAVSWTLGIGLVQILLVMTRSGVGPLSTLSLWPLSIFAGMIPVTLAGMGTRDAAFVYLLRATSPLGVDDAAVVTATIGYALIGTWLIAVLGVPFAVQLSMELSRSSAKNVQR